MRLPETLDRHGRAIVLVVLGLTLLYVLLGVDERWIPHDDGTLAHAAQRVLDGELPHRDFNDPYTGGQAYFHAALFTLLGERLLTLRVGLFLALVATVPAFYAIARRFAPPLVAAGVTVLAILWSVPVYPAAMPSWYNLFLAVLGTAALLRHLDAWREGQSGWVWLAAAGVCAGLSVLVKVVGLYFVAAGLLYLVFVEQTEGLGPPRTPDPEADPSSPDPDDGGPSSSRSGSPAWAFRAFSTMGLLGFAGAVWSLVSGAGGSANQVWFFLPPAALAGLLLWREWSGPPRRPSYARMKRLVGMGLPFLAGVAVPVLVFLVPYLATGSLGALYDGVFVRPGLRMQEFALSPPHVAQVLPLLALAGIMALVARAPRADGILAVILGIGLLLLLLMARTPFWYEIAWLTLFPVFPVLAVVGVGRLVRERTAASGGEGRERQVEPAARFVVLAAAVMVSLVAYPTFVPLYLFYALPLGALAGLAVIAPLHRAPWRSLAVLLVFHAAFAVRWIHPAVQYQVGGSYVEHPPTLPLELERAGIHVVEGEKEDYERMVQVVDRVAGEYIWATPDAPEVYFLTGRKNPTRTFFDFLDEQEGRVRRILDALERHDVQVVVLKRGPLSASGPPPEALVSELLERYPLAVEVGDFTVLWTGEEGG